MQPSNATHTRQSRHLSTLEDSEQLESHDVDLSEMADLDSDWSAKSNDALSISLVAADSGKARTLSTFHPKFTYPIFGDDESIFGYQGLKIQLRYHACDMRPGLHITYDKKFKPVGETSATDIKAILEDFLPKTAFDKSSIFDLNINDNIYQDWRPPGELLQILTAGDSTYEIWMGSLADLTVQQMVKRIQILIPLFIEGGTAINLKDPDWSLQRWTVFLLFKKISEKATSGGSSYVFVGYSTVYRYYHYQLLTPPSSPVGKKTHIDLPGTHDFQFPLATTNQPEIPHRSRISQFLILPPFHGGGLGSRFYEAIFNFYLNAPQTIEITVEDPNEIFDDLRDLCDIKRLSTMPEFTAFRIKTDVTVRQKGRVPTGKIVDLVAMESFRKKVKIAPRQFFRMVEMQLLSYIPTYIRKSLLHEQKKGTPAEVKAREHEYHLWQLFVKQRLYRHNKDTLIQLDRAERIDKLDDALNAVEADYGRLLRTADRRQKKKPANDDGGGNSKRAADEELDIGGPSMKKPKI